LPNSLAMTLAPAPSPARRRERSINQRTLGSLRFGSGMVIGILATGEEEESLRYEGIRYLQPLAH
jgi:hypothetical protein